MESREKLSIENICRYFGYTARSSRLDGSLVPLYTSWHPALENGIRSQLLKNDWTVIYQHDMVTIMKGREVYTGPTFLDALRGKLDND